MHGAAQEDAYGLFPRPEGRESRVVVVNRSGLLMVGRGMAG